MNSNFHSRCSKGVTLGEVVKGFGFLETCLCFENLLRLFLNLLLLQRLALFFASCDSLVTLTDERGGVELFSVFIVTFFPLFYAVIPSWRSELSCRIGRREPQGVAGKWLETLEWHADNNLWIVNFQHFRGIFYFLFLFKPP